MKKTLDDADLKEVTEAEFVEMLPQSLADIITQNNDVAEVRIANEWDIDEIAGNITPSDRLKDQMQDWSLITLHFLNTNMKQTYLLGDKSNGMGPRITSGVKAFDANQKLISTASGSLYGLGVPRTGQPSPYQLMLLCIALNDIGVGRGLGVPAFHKSILL